MKVKELSVVCAYLAFFLGITGFWGEISYPLWIGINIIVLCSYLNHLRWRLYFSGFSLNFLALAFVAFSIFMPARGVFEILLRILFVLCIIKFLSPLKQRDLWQIYTLNLFLLCMASICKFDLGFGFLLLGFLYISIVGLCFLTAEQFTKTDKIKKYLFYFSTFFTVVVLFVATIFFISLPRSPYAFLWGLSVGEKAKTGFGEKIDLRNIREIREDNSVAFRAIMPEKITSPYWRGVVYDTYKDGRWYMQLKEEKQNIVCPSKKVYTQTIFLEPYMGKTLITLDYPISLNLIAPKKFLVQILNNLSAVLPHEIAFRLEYKAFSCPIYPKSSLNLEERKAYLQVPQDVKIHLDNLVKKLVHTEDNPTVIAKKLKRFLNSPPFQYSLHISTPTKEDPIIYFLFVTHKGWCEHFSSALTLLLRTAGVPARLIGGYHGGTRNEMGNYYLVLQKDAHTWVEYWDEKTWKRIDPTPPQVVNKKQNIFFLSKWVDYLRLRWYAYIINYDFSKQRKLFSGLRRVLISKASWQINRPQIRQFHKQWIFVYLFLIIVGAIVFCAIFKRKKQNLLVQLQALLNSYGYTCQSYEGGLEWVQNITLKDQQLAHLVEEFIWDWYDIRYGKKKIDKKTYKNLNNLLKNIKNYLKKSKGNSK